MQQVLYMFYLVSLIIYLVVIGFIAWRFFTPFQRKVYLVLNLITFPIYLLYFFNIYSTPKELPFWNWFFNVNDEFGLMATYSSTILILIAVVALLMGLFASKNRWQQLFWFLNTFVFGFLAFDEYYLIHERLYLLVGLWQVVYIIFGLAVVVLGTFFWYRSRQYNWTIFTLYLLGLGVIGASGIALDFIFQEIACLDIELRNICVDLNLVEEIFETLGACFVMAIYLRLAHETLTPSRQRLIWRSMIGVTVIWLLSTLGYWWILPGVEARFAQPVNLTLDDGKVSLVAYSLPDTRIVPGESLKLVTYWRANEPIGDLYQISAHVLTQDLKSIAQDDPLANWFPSYAWIPGVTVRQEFNITLPENLEQPAAYKLTLRLWDLEEPDTYVTVSGDLPVLYGDTMAVETVTALNSEPLIDIPQSPQYIFQNGMKLLAYEMPSSAKVGETITLRFWWEAGSTRISDHRHFAHFVSTDNSAEPLIFDQIPYDGLLPTSAWIDGLAFVDTWQITIPEDATPGQYDVISGFFDEVTIARLPVEGLSDAPIRDEAMLLGLFEIQAK